MMYDLAAMSTPAAGIIQKPPADHPLTARAQRPHRLTGGDRRRRIFVTVKAISDSDNRT